MEREDNFVLNSKNVLENNVQSTTRNAKWLENLFSQFHKENVTSKKFHLIAKRKFVANGTNIVLETNAPKDTTSVLLLLFQFAVIKDSLVHGNKRKVLIKNNVAE
jgi:hypothetical protein